MQLGGNKNVAIHKSGGKKSIFWNINYLEEF